MQKRKTLEQEASSGNVFADLGLADAEEHLIAWRLRSTGRSGSGV